MGLTLPDSFPGHASRCFCWPLKLSVLQKFPDSDKEETQYGGRRAYATQRSTVSGSLGAVEDLPDCRPGHSEQEESISSLRCGGSGWSHCNAAAKVPTLGRRSPRAASRHGRTAFAQQIAKHRPMASTLLLA